MFQVQKMSVHRRFYTALALHDLVNEVPLAVVARKFGCSRGMLQSLQQSASTFAGGYYFSFDTSANQFETFRIMLTKIIVFWGLTSC
jgi:hypothetical protein